MVAARSCGFAVVLMLVVLPAAAARLRYKLDLNALPVALAGLVRAAGLPEVPRA